MLPLLVFSGRLKIEAILQEQVERVSAHHALDLDTEADGSCLFHALKIWGLTTDSIGDHVGWLVSLGPASLVLLI